MRKHTPPKREPKTVEPAGLSLKKGQAPTKKQMMPPATPTPFPLAKLKNLPQASVTPIRGSTAATIQGSIPEEDQCSDTVPAWKEYLIGRKSAGLLQPGQAVDFREFNLEDDPTEEQPTSISSIITMTAEEIDSIPNSVNEGDISAELEAKIRAIIGDEPKRGLGQNPPTPAIKPVQTEVSEAFEEATGLSPEAKNLMSSLTGDTFPSSGLEALTHPSPQVFKPTPSCLDQMAKIENLLHGTDQPTPTPVLPSSTAPKEHDMSGKKAKQLRREEREESENVKISDSLKQQNQRLAIEDATKTRITGKPLTPDASRSRTLHLVRPQPTPASQKAPQSSPSQPDFRSLNNSQSNWKKFTGRLVAVLVLFSFGYLWLNKPIANHQSETDHTESGITVDQKPAPQELAINQPPVTTASEPAANSTEIKIAGLAGTQETQPASVTASAPILVAQADPVPVTTPPVVYDQETIAKPDGELSTTIGLSPLDKPEHLKRGNKTHSNKLILDPRETPNRPVESTAVASTSKTTHPTHPKKQPTAKPVDLVAETAIVNTAVVITEPPVSITEQLDGKSMAASCIARDLLAQNELLNFDGFPSGLDNPDDNQNSFHGNYFGLHLASAYQGLPGN